ncbi:protein Hikeshi-like [Dendronephthya gigantea]|uniref:protein Hikeshi-like n=1 Tax=Dendronephthya gigantea TaxID=151771 RepID=UPI00106A8950|nr:protein Hikeshi-like [Dendronephthya gigantea]
MFGCVVSGRLIQTDFQQVSENQFVLSLSEPDKVHHIVIFLLGTIPFPEGMGGGVYFSWPGPQPAWQLLGHISNTKPSAIFKISQLHKTAESNPFGTSFTPNQEGMSLIGISVESLNDLSQQTTALHTTPSTLNARVEFTMKMLENFVNYASSFGLQQSQMTPNPQETYVPMGAVQKWFENFQRKMTNDPDFWKK